ncbi:MAG: hypothetical protein KH205_12405 [Ruminococcus sp.]|nr:hypothetical protein [Ruminococcus sp.]
MIKEKIKNIDLKDKIVGDIFDILDAKFNIHLDRASRNDIRLVSRDMVYLVYLLEQKYGITFNDSDMDDTAFYTVNGISDIICDRLYSDL